MIRDSGSLQKDINERVLLKSQGEEMDDLALEELSYLLIVVEFRI